MNTTIHVIATLTYTYAILINKQSNTVTCKQAGRKIQDSCNQYQSCLSPVFLKINKLQLKLIMHKPKKHYILYEINMRTLSL